MKKTMLPILCLLLCALPLSTALGEIYTDPASGLSLPLPDAFVVEDVSGDDTFALSIRDPALENVAYAYTVFYEENLDGAWMEDLYDGDYPLLLGALLGDAAGGEYGLETIGEALYLVAATVDGGVHYIALLDGWVCVLSVLATEGTPGDAALEGAAALLEGVFLQNGQ